MDGRLDLTRARREAKALLAAARAGDPAARARLGAAPKLSAAQLAVARDWGERSWPALVRRAEAEPEATARATPLARAVGDAELTAQLLPAGADPRDEEAVRRAAAAEDPGSLRLLMAAGADPRRTQALATVLEREDPDTVALVLDHVPEDSGERAWALLWAVQHGRSEEIVRLLVERGADLEAYDEGNDRRPYGLAIRRGRPDLAELLASLGARASAARCCATRCARRTPPGRVPRCSDPRPTRSPSTACSASSCVPICATARSTCPDRSGLLMPSLT